MRKIAVNRCFGGFGLSEAATRRYLELKGLPCYVQHNSWGSFECFTKAPQDREHQYDGLFYAGRETERDDPLLIQVIEELGKDADGDCAQLAIVEIPDDVQWQIEEYDGAEHVAEVHRTW